MSRYLIAKDRVHDRLLFVRRKCLEFIDGFHHGHQISHVASDGCIDVGLGGRFNEDCCVLRLRQERVFSAFGDPGMCLPSSQKSGSGLRGNSLSGLSSGCA